MVRSEELRPLFQNKTVCRIPQIDLSAAINFFAAIVLRVSTCTFLFAAGTMGKIRKGIIRGPF